MPTLILVHIGTELPEYIHDCISQVRSVSDINVHVLVEEEHVSKFKDVEVFSLNKIPSSKQRKDFETVNRLDSSFRGGFWKFAMMRFFYIYDHMVSNNICDVFHIENDNLIFLDFQKKIDIFRSKSMWCVFDSPDRVIPSFLYFKDSGIVKRLLDECLYSASIGRNDMNALAEFQKKNSVEVGILPIIVDYVDRIDEMYFKHAEEFGCLFDAAAVGQYIGGVDPRNKGGDTTGFINETSVIKCDKIKIQDKIFLNGLPLVNLHIHSKNLKKHSTFTK